MNSLWCIIEIQLQQLHIGEQKLIGHLKRVYNIPTKGITRLRLDYENYEFKYEDDWITLKRRIMWKPSSGYTSTTKQDKLK